MTANVITYRGRSAAREVGKVLSLEPAQVDRLAKVMNHFEWVDPEGDARAQPARGRPRLPRSDDSAVRDAVAADPGSAAASRPALRRDGDVPRPPRRHRPARERQHARPRRRPVGQGRLRRHGPRQSRSARPRDDGGAAGCAVAGEYEVGDSAIRGSALDSQESRRSALDASRRGVTTSPELRHPAPRAPSRPERRAPSAEPRRCPSAERRAPSRRHPSSTSPTSPPMTRRSTGCCRRPTRSGSSRSSRGRRWRRCRGFARSASTTSSSKSRSSGPGRSSGRWCIRI